MSDAKKCNRCATLFEPKAGDLTILDLHEYAMPNPRMKDSDLEERAIYSNSDNECDLCTPCSHELRDFLKPIRRPEAGRPSDMGIPK